MVGGDPFPSSGRLTDSQIPKLETAVASLASAINLIAERLDEMERDRRD
jgi:hypothetical protein